MRGFRKGRVVAARPANAASDGFSGGNYSALYYTNNTISGDYNAMVRWRVTIMEDFYYVTFEPTACVQAGTSRQLDSGYFTNSTNWRRVEGEYVLKYPDAC